AIVQEGRQQGRSSSSRDREGAAEGDIAPHPEQARPLALRGVWEGDPAPHGPLPHGRGSETPGAATTAGGSVTARGRRIWSLVRKEARQIVRDPSSIAIGVVLPVILILLFGYGLSLDVMNVPVAVVLEDPSPAATEVAAGYQISPYFSARLMTSMAQAEALM